MENPDETPRYPYLFDLQQTASAPKDLVLTVFTPTCCLCSELLIETHHSIIQFGCQHATHGDCMLPRLDPRGRFPLMCPECTRMREPVAVAAPVVQPVVSTPAPSEPEPDDNEDGITFGVSMTEETRKFLKKYDIDMTKVLSLTIDWKLIQSFCGVRNITDWGIELRKNGLTKAWIDAKNAEARKNKLKTLPVTIDRLLEAGISMKHLFGALQYRELKELVDLGLKNQHIVRERKTDERKVDFSDLAILFNVRYSDLLKFPELGVRNMVEFAKLEPDIEELRFLGIDNAHKLIKRGLDFDTMRVLNFSEEAWHKQLGLTVAALKKMKFTGKFCKYIGWNPVKLMVVLGMTQQDKKDLGLGMDVILST